LNCPLLLISTGHEGIRKFIDTTEFQSNDFLLNWSKIFKTWLNTAENWLKSRLIPLSSSSSTKLELTPNTLLYPMNSQFLSVLSGNSSSSQDSSLLAFDGLPLTPIRCQNLLYYINSSKM
jgi:hypothetical protein